MKLTDQQLTDLINESRSGSERLKFLATEAVHEIRTRRDERERARMCANCFEEPALHRCFKCESAIRKAFGMEAL